MLLKHRCIDCIEGCESWKSIASDHGSTKQPAYKINFL